MNKKVAVLLGAGSIGQAIIRRVSAGKHIVLADYNTQNILAATKTLEDAGFECSKIQTDLGSKEWDPPACRRSPAKSIRGYHSAP